MRGCVAGRRGRFYAVIYGGHDPVTGKERRSWHPAGTDRAKAERLAAIARTPKQRALQRIEGVGLTEEELRQLLRPAAGHQFFRIYWLTAMTGMRRNELLGLKWTDIDFGKRRLHLNGGLVAVAYDIHQTGGKTNTARRAIDLDDTTNDIAWETFERTGASVMSTRMFDLGGHAWAQEAPFHTPVFVVTHAERDPWARPAGTTFHFVNDGIESALDDARETAGGRDVRIAGGGATIMEDVNARRDRRVHDRALTRAVRLRIRLFEAAAQAA